MARLTWNNVDAPSLSGVSQGLATAGSLFGAGSEAIANAFQGIGDRRMTAISNDAVANLQRFNNVSDFDRAMAQGGLAGVLGVDPSSVNADAMRAAQDYRNVILGQADTQAQTRGRDASTAFTQAQTQTELLRPEEMRTDMAQTRAQTEQQKLETQVTNYGFGRQQLGDNVSDAASVNKMAGEDYATRLLRDNPKIVKPEDAIYAIVHDGTLNAQQKEAAIAVVNDADKFKMLTTPSAPTTSRMSQNSYLTNMDKGLSETQAAREQAALSDPKFALYNEYSSSLKGGLAPGQAQKSILGWAGEMNKLSPTGDESATADSAADLTEMFTDLKIANPNAPDSLILAAMQGARQERANWVLGDFDRIRANYGNIDSIIKQMNDPDFQNEQRGVQSSFEQEKSKWSNLDGRLQTAKLRLARVMDSNDMSAKEKQDAIQNSYREIDGLNKELEGLKQVYPGKIPTRTAPDGSVSMDFGPQSINTGVDPANMTEQQKLANAVAAGKNTPTSDRSTKPAGNPHTVALPPKQAAAVAALANAANPATMNDNQKVEVAVAIQAGEPLPKGISEAEARAIWAEVNGNPRLMAMGRALYENSLGK